MIGISASPTVETSRCHSALLLPLPSPRTRPPPNLKLRTSLAGSGGRRGVRCSSSGPPSPGSGENDSKVILDAFFLGKAFAEALNERIESSVGEILSVIGQWQAEQQKQVQDFQEEVIERAKKAKEKASLEVMEEQGVISKSLRAPSDTATPADSSPSPGPKTEDPFQEMLKD
ncbi:uncharacterized protein At4g13200, chloroplastic [Phoenix dactylifera]|uniref:Uncharacterized protein At4g13200, chloroplastic n=1 Tax=Phoenix dactylifera TaxID=42345 RepID=A0A8B7CML8_PHODC|nr:uncharacterized protein At4g13200, chloroplastic [Phoenix dactylifera]